MRDSLFHLPIDDGAIASLAWCQDGFDGHGSVRGVATWEDGSVVLAGHTGNVSSETGETHGDFAAVKLNGDGQEVWKWQASSKNPRHCVRKSPSGREIHVPKEVKRSHPSLRDRKMADGASLQDLESCLLPALFCGSGACMVSGVAEEREITRTWHHYQKGSAPSLSVGCRRMLHIVRFRRLIYIRVSSLAVHQHRVLDDVCISFFEVEGTYRWG